MLILDKAGTDKLLFQLEKQEAFDSRYQFCKADGGLKLLGTGGFSSVYEMYDSVASKRHYAMKIIGLGEKTADEDFIFETTQIQYFLGEQSENVMRIINLWIMKVHLDETGNVTGITGVNEEEYEKAGGIPVQLVLMEKLDPVLLKDKYGNVEVLREDLKSEEEVLRVAKDIGSALSTAHENGIIHRDVKLENIFWDKHLQQYKLGDFGVARYVENGDAETVVFTDGYGAPEIERHLTEAYDLTVDIYSFGISLFLLMNGLKFPASDEYRSVFVQYSKDFIMPAPENASEDLARIIRKMCSYSAEERYQSIEEVLLEINRVKCSYEKVDGTEYEDLETETYRDEEDTVLSADQKIIEENGTQKDTDEEEWWTKDDSELSREQRIIKERCYNEAYRDMSIRRMMAAAVLFALFFEQFYSGKYYVTRGQFWILPIIMLGCSVLEIIEEFYVEFEIITIGFILFSMYSLGIHVPQVVMMMVILLRIPAITAGCAIGTGLWIGLASSNLIRLSLVNRLDLGWIFIIGTFAVVESCIFLRLFLKKESEKRFNRWCWIVDNIWYILIAVGILLLILEQFHVLVIPEMVRRIHLIRVGIGIFLIEIFYLNYYGMLEDEEEEVNINESVDEGRNL